MAPWEPLVSSSLVEEKSRCVSQLLCLLGDIRMIHFSLPRAAKSLEATASGWGSQFLFNSAEMWLSGSVCLGWCIWDQKQASCLHSASLDPAGLLVIQAPNSLTIALTTVTALM